MIKREINGPFKVAVLSFLVGALIWGIFSVALKLDGYVERLDDKLLVKYKPRIERCLKVHTEFQCREFIDLNDDLFDKALEEFNNRPMKR